MILMVVRSHRSHRSARVYKSDWPGGDQVMGMLDVGDLVLVTPEEANSSLPWVITRLGCGWISAMHLRKIVDA